MTTRHPLLRAYGRKFLQAPTWQTKRLALYPFRSDSAMFRLSLDLPRGWVLNLHGFKPHKEDLFHDHPWPFWTFVLWGGYTDVSTQTPPATATGAPVLDVLRAGSLRHRPACHAHRTICFRKTWTLVLMGPWEREACHGDEKTWLCGANQFFDA